jgi:hypothetical protein
MPAPDVRPFIATALTQKTIVEGLEELRAERWRVERGLLLAWSAASAARVIETLLPALDVFLAKVDRTNALVDERIADGTWESHPFLAVARERLESYRMTRDKLSALVKRAATGGVTRRELMAALRSSY